MDAELNTRCKWQHIKKKIDTILAPIGFESYPFKICWYNAKVREEFCFDYPASTLAFIICSTPSMFEKAFVPFVCSTQCLGVRDPIDECMAKEFQQLKQEFPEHDVEVIHDFEMHYSRRPKVLVQTAGHVAGAAYYYQRSDVKHDPWDEKKKIFGVSIHPSYGGWFAFRGVVIFKTMQAPDLLQTLPPDVLATDELKIEVLSRFNGNWEDWTYRDIIPVADQYSELQKKYFATLPKDRKGLLDVIRAEGVKIGGHGDSQILVSNRSMSRDRREAQVER